MVPRPAGTVEAAVGDTIVPAMGGVRNVFGAVLATAAGPVGG